MSFLSKVLQRSSIEGIATSFGQRNLSSLPFLVKIWGEGVGFGVCVKV